MVTSSTETIVAASEQISTKRVQTQWAVPGDVSLLTQEPSGAFLVALAQRAELTQLTSSAQLAFGLARPSALQQCSRTVRHRSDRTNMQHA